ncbi:MAG: hypothetical protein MK132_05755 [Lentisphaerales bacterium]|nr:hypothetical protein [Lentisphaerales bacterium]
MSSKKSRRLNALSRGLTTIKYQNGCAFNFYYLDLEQTPVTYDNLSLLIDRLKFLSEQKLEHWSSRPIAGGRRGRNRYFKKLNDFTFSNSNLTQPANVRDDVEWSQFYIAPTFRLIGFTEKVEADPDAIDIFYVVFIDPSHDFYSP